MVPAPDTPDRDLTAGGDVPGDGAAGQHLASIVVGPRRSGRRWTGLPQAEVFDDGGGWGQCGAGMAGGPQWQVQVTVQADHVAPFVGEVEVRGDGGGAADEPAGAG